MEDGHLEPRVNGAKAGTTSLRSLTGADPLALADRSLANTVTYMARHARGGAAEDRDGLVLFAGGHPYPGAYCNGAIRLDRALDVDTVLSRGRGFFNPRRRGFILWARSGDDADLIERCRHENWHERPPVEGMPIIRLERHRLTAPGDLPVDAPTARPVRTEADADAYLRVLGDAYQVPDAPRSILESIFCSPAAMLGAEGAAALVDLDGRAVAGSMGVAVGGLGCSLFIATAPAARRRGLGAVCHMAVLNAMFEAGADAVYAQSSQMGLRRWVELGFEVIGHYHRFLVPPRR